MKNVLLLLVFLLLLASCTGADQEDGLFADVYFAVNLDTDSSGPAVESRPVAVAALTAGAVMEALLAADPPAGLLPPFPPGTAMLSYTVREGTATVLLSSPYGRLTGTALTVADICAALTLSALPGIHRVRLLADGGVHPARDDRAISREDILLGAPPALRSLERVITVYAVDETGHLVREERVVFIRENEPLERYVVRELLRPNDGLGLSSPFPPETVLIGAATEHGICFVNFTSASIGNLPDREAGIALEALRRSLIAIEGISAVQFLLDGGTVETFGGRDTSEPLR
jgi:spore germination protein GerM